MPHLVTEMLDVLEAAPPAVRAEDLDVAAGHQVLGQVAADEAGVSRDQNPHQESPSKKLRTAATTLSISSGRSSGKQGSESTSRAAAHAAGYELAS